MGDRPTDSTIVNEWDNQRYFLENITFCEKKSFIIFCRFNYLINSNMLLSGVPREKHGKNSTL